MPVRKNQHHWVHRKLHGRSGRYGTGAGPTHPQNILDNAIKMFDTLPDDQKDAFIQKYEGGQEDFAEA